MLIDSHAHLTLPEFHDTLDETLNRAWQQGLSAIITVGIDERDSFRAVGLAERHDRIFATVGIHPHDVKNIGHSTYEKLKILAANDKVVAYGEIGLDFFRNRSPREEQLRRFGEQLEIAYDAGLPVVIHDREAHGETMAMLKPWKAKLRGVLHCFSGDCSLATAFIDLGFYISIPGAVTFSKAVEMQEVARRIPLDSMLVETDAPFLAPVPFRGRNNEPSYIVHTAQRIADLRKTSFAAVASATAHNAENLFSLPSGERGETAQDKILASQSTME
ncbi:MAG: TatD family hydrolase [Deltaproteobacteria bacterium]|nr:TatD family hydrolase [Deltaproteobacteria bacterium]